MDSGAPLCRIRIRSVDKLNNFDESRLKDVRNKVEPNLSARSTYLPLLTLSRGRKRSITSNTIFMMLMNKTMNTGRMLSQTCASQPVHDGASESASHALSSNPRIWIEIALGDVAN